MSKSIVGFCVRLVLAFLFAIGAIIPFAGLAPPTIGRAFWLGVIFASTLISAYLWMAHDDR